MSTRNAGGMFVDKMRLYDAIMADAARTDADHRVAWALLFGFHNSRTGECYPPIPVIANRARLKPRATFDAIKQLVERGWFRYTPGGGRGHANQYEPALERVRRRAPFTEAETVHGGARNGARRRRETVHDRAPQHLYLTQESTPSSAAAKFSQQGKTGSGTPEPEKSSPAQRPISVSDPGDKGRGALVRIVKTFHISEENARALVDGALGDLDIDELRAIIARAKASNFNRDELQAAIGEAVGKRRAAPAAEARAKARAKREAAEQRRQADAEAAHQAEHGRRLAEEPAYRVQTRYFDFVAKSPSRVMDWMQWLPGAVEAAGEAEVEEWHRHAQDRAPDRPLPYLRDRLAEWHQARQVPLADANGSSASESKPDKQGDPGGDDDLRAIPDFLRRIPVPKGI